MKKIDIYIIKKFLGTFLYSLLLIIIIVIVFDISEKIDDFIENEAPLKAIIFEYYLNFIPYFVNLFSALFTFIAVIFFTSKLTSNSEIIAILSSGISFKRLLVPYMVSAIIITIFSFILINWVIPNANAKRFQFEDTYWKTYRNRDKNIHKQILPQTFVYLDSYNNLYDIGYKFSMEKFEKGKLKSKLISDYIKWDTIKNNWQIVNYTIRDFVEGKEIITKGDKIDTTINMTTTEFDRLDDLVEAMNYKQLDEFIEHETLIGSENITLWKIEKHKRFAFPFSTIILTVIGVSISSRKRRSGIGANIGIGILLAFSYIMFMQVSTVMAKNAGMNPLLSVWIPNIVFGMVAIALYLRAAK